MLWLGLAGNYSSNTKHVFVRIPFSDKQPSTYILICQTSPFSKACWGYDTLNEQCVRLCMQGNPCNAIFGDAERKITSASID